MLLHSTQLAWCTPNTQCTHVAAWYTPTLSVLMLLHGAHYANTLCTHVAAWCTLCKHSVYSCCCMHGAHQTLSVLMLLHGAHQTLSVLMLLHGAHYANSLSGLMLLHGAHYANSLSGLMLLHGAHQTVSVYSCCCMVHTNTQCTHVAHHSVYSCCCMVHTNTQCTHVAHQTLSVLMLLHGAHQTVSVYSCCCMVHQSQWTHVAAWCTPNSLSWTHVAACMVHTKHSVDSCCCMVHTKHSSVLMLLHGAHQTVSVCS